VQITGQLHFVLTLVAALGCGLMAGAFFAFSTFVMKALFRWPEPGTAYLLIGGLLYLVGTLLVTITFNVPKNEALAAITAGDADGQSQWTNYVATWTAWNHVRTLAALAASASFGISLDQGSFG
jgi:uncharacterized membrane protein